MLVPAAPRENIRSAAASRMRWRVALPLRVAGPRVARTVEIIVAMTTVYRELDLTVQGWTRPMASGQPASPRAMRRARVGARRIAWDWLRLPRRELRVRGRSGEVRRGRV